MTGAHAPCVRALVGPEHWPSRGTVGVGALRSEGETDGVAVSMTPAAILRSLSLIVLNSAVARSRGCGMSVADGEDAPINGGVEDEADLVGERRCDRRRAGPCAA
jgi:hypothetical protein